MLSGCFPAPTWFVTASSSLSKHSRTKASMFPLKETVPMKMVDRDREWMAVTSFNFEQNAAMPKLSKPILLNHCYALLVGRKSIDSVLSTNQ